MCNRFSDADPYAGSIQCPVGTVAGCTFTTGGGVATLSSDSALLPAVLHAYTADIAHYAAPMPGSGRASLLLGGLPAVGLATRRRRG